MRARAQTARVAETFALTGPSDRGRSNVNVRTTEDVRISRLVTQSSVPAHYDWSRTLAHPSTRLRPIRALVEHRCWQAGHGFPASGLAEKRRTHPVLHLSVSAVTAFPSTRFMRATRSIRTRFPLAPLPIKVFSSIDWTRSAGFPALLFAATLAVSLVLGLVFPRGAQAHAESVRADPPDGLVVAPPRPSTSG